MRNPRHTGFIVGSILVAVLAPACAPIDPMSLVARSALFLIERDINHSRSSEPISIKELLTQAIDGSEPGKSKGASPMHITFTLPPDIIELSAGQRTDLADKLRNIDTGTPYTVVISSGPGSSSGDSMGAFIAVQRARSAALHFSDTKGKPRLRYDPALGPGELRINIEPTKRKR